MRMSELRDAFNKEGKIEKKLFLQIMRENYMHYLPEIQEVLADNEDCVRILIEKDGCVLERKNGVKLYFDFTQAVCRAEAELLMEGEPEEYAMQLVSAFLSYTKGRTVLDIGANVGLYSLDLYQHHKEIEYYLFEPVPMTFERLIQTEKLNNVDTDHYKAFNLGMSDKKGTFDFFVPASNEAASMVANEDSFYRKRYNATGNYTGQTNIEKVQCKVTTVDDFVAENDLKGIDFIKIDVEGNEKAVLAGAEQTVKRFVPLLYVELLRKHAKRFGYHPNEVIRHMKSLGYQCVTLQDKKIIPMDCMDEETVQTNFFFYHKQKHGTFWEKLMHE